MATDDLGMIESIPGLPHAQHGVSGPAVHGDRRNRTTSPSPGRWGIVLAYVWRDTQ